MTIHHIDSNESYSTEITIQNSDEYSKLVYVKIVRDYKDEEIRGVNEMFMTPEELESLGKFLIEQAKILKK